MNADQNRSALTPGYKLHWYSIERVLGHGGFGITYLARDTNLNQQVAIKEFFPSEIAMRNEDMSVQPKANADADQYKWGLDRFRSEAQTLARFDHPNIIRIFTVFEANHTAYLIMRYEKGEALNDILERYKRLPEDELLNIVLPILDGLGKVHETGFVHRDIQPANIYIREDKSPVLIDFGAARESLGRPRTITILVAPGYAPYEQYIANNQEQGPWTDIYGLGATLYRAIAGVAPIDAIERSRGILGSTRDVLVPATVVGQGRYSESFLKAVDHALMFNERDRPQSAAEWAQELRTGQPQEQKAVIDKHPGSSSSESNKILNQATDSDKEYIPESQDNKTGILIRWAAPILLFLVGIAVGVMILNGDNVDDENSGTDTVKSIGVITPEEVAQNDATPIPMEAGKAEPGNIPVPGQVTEDEPRADEGASRQLMEKISELEKRLNDNETRAQEMAATSDEGAVKHSDQIRQQIESDSEKLASLEKELSSLESKRLAEQKRLQKVIEERLRAQETVYRTPASIDTPEKTGTPATVQATLQKQAQPTTPGSAVVSVKPDPLTPALDAFRENDYDKAFDLFKPLADQGSAVAQYHLAGMYRNGQGILANNGNALLLMRKAAWQGHGDAQAALAKMYYEGVDGKKDFFMAYTWYLLAERNGINSHVRERVAAEHELQLEQLPQALALVNYLYRQQAQKGGDFAGQE